MEEIWKDVSGHDISYQISNTGRIRRLKSEILIDGNRRTRTLPAKELVPRDNSNGYFYIKLFHPHKQYHVAHLVWDYFGNGAIRGKNTHIDHINSNRSDNRISNLQLLTARENTSKGQQRMVHTSEYTGVEKRKNGKWWAKIRIDGKQHYLGQWDNELDAKTEYDRVLSVYIQTGIFDKKKRSNKYSSYNGVSFNKRNNKFTAAKTTSGKKVFLGYFNTEYEAINAVKRFTGEIH